MHSEIKSKWGTMHISIVKALRRPVGNYLTVFQSVILNLFDYKLSICLAEHAYGTPFIRLGTPACSGSFLTREGP